MKKIVEHLSDIIIAVAGVMLLIGVILTFSGSLQEFYTRILNKVEDSIIDGGENNGDENDVTELSAPSISLSNDTLLISTVENATNYILYIDNVEVVTISETTVDLTAYNLSVGHHSLAVKAMADGYGVSQKSNIIIYTVTLRATLDIEVAGYTGNYDGTPHGITVTCAGATITYSTSENGEYTSTNPQFTDAGVYTVYYKVVKSGYETVSGSEIVTINKASNTLVLSATSGSLTYPNTGSFTVNTNTSGGALTVTSSNKSVASVSINGTSVTIVPGTTAGTAIITITSASTDNYNQASITYQVAVEPGKLAAPVISLSSNVLTISAVANATSYDVYINDSVKTTVTNTSVDLSTLGLANDDYTITVKAKAEGYSDSLASNSIKSYIGEAVTGEITDSWEEIIAAVNDDSYKQRYAVGAYKPLNLGSEGIINMQIAAMDADVLSDGTGNAPITWIAMGLLKTKHSMRTDNTNASGWGTSAMRTYLHNDIWALIPAEVQASIVAVDKTYYRRIGDPTTATSSDKLWVPSSREVLGNGNEDSGVVYSEIFTNSNSRVRTLDGTASYWWLRSAHHVNVNTFWSVTSSGTTPDNPAGHEYGVLLCFCMG